MQHHGCLARLRSRTIVDILLSLSPYFGIRAVVFIHHSFTRCSKSAHLCPFFFPWMWFRNWSKSVPAEKAKERRRKKKKASKRRQHRVLCATSTSAHQPCTYVWALCVCVSALRSQNLERRNSQWASSWDKFSFRFREEHFTILINQKKEKREEGFVLAKAVHSPRHSWRPAHHVPPPGAPL